MEGHPTELDLRNASLGLHLARVMEPFAQVAEAALRVEEYRQRAACLGVGAERVDEILREAQELAAGSTPTEAELARAWSMVIDEAMNA